MHSRTTLIGVDGTVFVDSLTGIGRYCYELLIHWAAQSPEKQFFVYTPFELSVTFEQPNIIIKESSVFKKGRRFNRLKKLLWMEIFLPVLLLRDNVDLYWSGNGIIPALKTVSMMITLHDFVYKLYPQTMHKMSLYNRIINQAVSIRNADLIFVNSANTGIELQEYFQRDANLIIRPAISDIFHPRNQTEIEKVITKYGLENRYALVVSTLEPRKNLELFLEIYLDLIKQGHPLPQLAIIGKEGWGESRIKQALTTGIARGIVKPLGYIDYKDLPALYSGCNVYFMPSLYEGFGIPILEARSCGASVICSDAGGMKEAGGDTSIYHQPTPEGIRQALVHYAKTSEVKQSTPEISNWNWKHSALKLSELVDSHLSQKNH